MNASPAPVLDTYELSPMQQGMLFHALHTPDSGTSFNQMSCRIIGPLDIAQFILAWQRLVDRHTILRSSFHWREQTTPTQVVQPQCELPWVQEDWRELSMTEQRSRWAAVLQQDCAAGFDLEQAPLMRCRLARLAEHDYFFCWSHHHLLSDGWCLNLVMEEVFHVYGHLTHNAPLALPTARPYRDYIEWLRRQKPEAARQYWSRYLKGFRTPTALPGSDPSSERSGAATAQLQTELSLEVSAGLRKLAAQHGLTLSTFVQGAWALLLARYSSETDVVFGTTVSGRPTELAGVERMLGNFINTVPVRMQVDPKQPLVPWLKMIQARMAARGAFDHTPLSEIQRCSEVAPPAPLFESNVIFMNYPLDADLARGAHGLALEDVKLYDRADVPIELQVTALERWQIELAFDPQRFAESAMQRMLGHVATLLESFLSHAAKPIGQLPMLTAAERQEIVEDFNNTDVAFETAETIVHRLQKIAANMPDHIAVECNDATLTASELNSRANRLARRLLQTAALQADDLVAICAPRSERMMVAILAIWKCGAAYLPINPAYPAQRIQTILDDSRAKLIIASSGSLDAALQLNAPVVDLDTTDLSTTAADDTNLDLKVSGENLAYVIYTSGSTGKPKGAMIEHAGMLNHMLAEVDELAIRSTSVVAQNASHCFDISVWQFFTAPLVGGKTVILDNEVVSEPARFLERMAASHITVLELVPSYLTVLLERSAAERAPLEQLQVILITGEMINPALLERWFALYPKIPVVNAYGPAEASDDIAQHRLERAPLTAYVPVGKPIRNLRIYITDAQMNLCPIGIPGEICVSGIGVGRGYLNNEAASRAAFLHDPFRSEAGVRLYRTGDTGQLLPDGTLLMLGRKDQQVKIQGHRIELGEVENALTRLQPISQAAVIDHRDATGHAALCAYVAFRAGAAMTEEQMVTALSAALPSYMVPRAYIVLDKLPLSSNGKINRKALPAPQLSRLAVARETTLPRTPVEQRLCDIWADVLGLTSPGVHENFFALGGDSILSMRIAALAAKAGLKITTRQIFQHPTVAELAAVAVSEKPGTVEIIESSGPLPLTPVQRLFFSHRKTQQNEYNQAVLLEVPRDLDPALLTQALRHTSKFHDALRLRFQLTETGWKQQVAPDLNIPLATHEIERNRLESLIAHSHAALDFEQGPVLHADLIRFAKESSARLLLVAHHLVVDAVSWSVLLETLYSAYERLSNGQSPETPAGAASWTRWTQAFDQRLRSDESKRDLAHWQSLRDLKPLALPVDREAPKNSNLVSSAEELAVNLSEPATAKLLTSAPQAYGAQITDLLLAALALTFTRWTGDAGVLLKLESHGRDTALPDLDISRTVGWFTVESPVWLQIDPAQRAHAQVIESIQAQLRRVPSQGPSYVDTSELPWPQVSFNYLGQLANALSNTVKWTQAPEPAGDGRAKNQEREHLLDINCFVTDGCLRIAVEYSRHSHHRETIERLAQNYLQTLEAIVADAQVDAGEVYELTPTQQGMLFHGLYDPGSHVYLSSLSGHIQGALNAERFQQAWSEIMQRHAVLRTSFHWEGVPQPVQRVHATAPLPWREEDFSSEDRTAAERRWQSILDDERTRTLDFTQAPLMRLCLARTGEDRWRFNWTQHHILLDGWSAGLLLSEVMAIYGNESQVPSPPPYRNYVRWLRDQNHAAAALFWKERLLGFETPTPLMLGRPEMEGTARAGKYQEEMRALSAEDTRLLQQFAQANRLTLNTVAQGVWSLLLSRYSGETDVLHGTIFSGRPASLAGSDRMIGLFINSLPVRVQVPECALAPWLHQLQLDLAQLEDYAWFPLADLQKLTTLPAGAALFETLLIFQNYPLDEVAGRSPTDLKIDALEVFDPNNYPLTLVVTPGERLTLQVLYDSGRFDRDCIARLLEHFATLISSFPSAGDQPIRKLPMLTAKEQRQIVQEWGNTFFPIPQQKTVADLIESAAESHPRRIAVRCGGSVRTYEEITRNADRIAHRLLAAADIQPDDRIAVLMPRSASMVETILAIWKCGAAYVPIDPAYPAARIESILESARPKLIVSDAALEGHDTISPLIESESDTGDSPVTNLSTQSGLAYVIFTSGSTGKPKGAMLEHQGMLNHVLCMARELALHAETTVAQTASHCSDISVWQLFAALVSGGETVIYSDAVVLEPCRLVDLLLRDRVHALQLVPSYLAAFLAELERRADPSLPHLRTLVTIGEALQPASVQTWFRLNPDVQLMNAYGPTEASDSVSHFTMSRMPALPAIPIGKAIQNMRLYIVDRDMNLCPIGVKGEICIAGLGVGRGYLFDEARTGAVFANDPFSDNVPSRLYHSGDVGCLSPDGNVLFFGRRDFQVKLRGYRIELGEIETALTSLPGITQAVVIARKDASGGLSLCGYVTGNGLNASTVRQALRERIPSYMVPDFITLLAELPVTPNGKINRAALPAPDAPAQSRAAYASPKNATEEALVRIFADVLACESVDVEADFFELGGQSLKAIQMLSRIRSELSASITVADIFGAPSPRALAKKLEQTLGPAARDWESQHEQISALPARDGEGRHEQIPALPARDGESQHEQIPALPARPWFAASHAQKRIWLASRNAEPHAYNMAGALQIEGPLAADRMVHAFEQLVDRHESLRTVFALKAGELQQKILTREASGFKVERRVLVGELDDLLRQEAEHAFNLAHGPLIRATLIELKSDTHVLALTLHHAIADAWSIGILSDELRALYEGRELPPLTIQYRDYAEWHNSYLESAQAQIHRMFWANKLAHPLPRLDLPTDFPRPERLTYAGRSLDLELMGSRLQALVTLCREHRTSLYTLILSSIAVLLHRWTGREDIVIGGASAGRNHQQLESQIGVFLNTLVLRMRVRSSMSVTEVITAVSQTSAEALEHADYPFDLLLEDLQVRTPANHFPLFDVQVDYIPRLRKHEDPNITELAREDTTTKFDLSFHVTEEEHRLVIRLIYNTKLFKPETIAGLRDQLLMIQDTFIEPAAPPAPAPRKARARLRMT